MSPVNALRQHWWVIALFVLLGGAAGWIPNPQQVEEQATQFTATHTMLTNDGGDNSIVSPSQVTLLATVGEVPERVASALDFSGNPAELASLVAVAFDFDNGALTFSTTQDTAEYAVLVADTFANELNAYLRERQDFVYQDRLAGSRERLQGLEADLDDITNQLAISPSDAILLAERDAISRQYGLAFEQNRDLEGSSGQLTFTTLEFAQAVPVVDRGLSAPTSRSTRAVMGVVVGAVLGSLIALVLGRIDRKIRSREQAEEIVGLRARVLVPSVKRTEGGVVVHPGRHDPLSDSYRTIRNVVEFVEGSLEPRKGARVTLVVSPGSGDGKTSLAANLAAAFVERGERTIAVNTDFRRPRLHQAIMGTPPPDVPFDLAELDDVPRHAIPLDTTAHDMKIIDLTTVPGSPGQLARATARQIERLGDAADQIVIDSSPVGVTAEVLDLVPMADVIVLVARVGHTSNLGLERAIAIVRDLTAVPIVFVLGGVKPERSPYDTYDDRRPGDLLPPPELDPQPRTAVSASK